MGNEKINQFLDSYEPSGSIDDAFKNTSNEYKLPSVEIGSITNSLDFSKAVPVPSFSTGFDLGLLNQARDEDVAVLSQMEDVCINNTPSMG